MPSDENVFAQAARALSRVESVATTGREILDAIKTSEKSAKRAVEEFGAQAAQMAGRFDTASTQTSERIAAAMREMQSARGELLSSRSDLSATVGRIRQSEEALMAEFAKRDEALRQDLQSHLRATRRVVWLALLLSFLGAAAGTIVVLLVASRLSV